MMSFFNPSVGFKDSIESYLEIQMETFNAAKPILRYDDAVQEFKL